MTDIIVNTMLALFLFIVFMLSVLAVYSFIMVIKFTRSVLRDLQQHDKR